MYTICSALQNQTVMNISERVVAKFKCPCVLDDQKTSEDNQKLRPGYQISWEELTQNFHPNKSFKLSFSHQ